MFSFFFSGYSTIQPIGSGHAPRLSTASSRQVEPVRKIRIHATLIVKLILYTYMDCSGYTYPEGPQVLRTSEREMVAVSVRADRRAAHRFIYF